MRKYVSSTERVVIRRKNFDPAPRKGEIGSKDNDVREVRVKGHVRGTPADKQDRRSLFGGFLRRRRGTSPTAPAEEFAKVIDR